MSYKPNMSYKPYIPYTSYKSYKPYMPYKTKSDRKSSNFKF